MRPFIRLTPASGILDEFTISPVSTDTIIYIICHTSEYFLYLFVLKIRFDAEFEFQEFDSKVEFVMKRVILFSICRSMKSLFSVSSHLIWKFSMGLTYTK